MQIVIYILASISKRVNHQYCFAGFRMSAYEQIRNRLSSNGKVTKVVISHITQFECIKTKSELCIHLKYLSGQKWIYTMEKGCRRYECRRWGGFFLKWEFDKYILSGVQCVWQRLKGYINKYFLCNDFETSTIHELKSYICFA